MKANDLRQIISSLFAAYFSVMPVITTAQPKYECHKYVRDGRIVKEVVELRRLDGMELLFKVNTTDINLPDYVPNARDKCGNKQSEPGISR